MMPDYNITDFDLFFLSYDEPNSELNFADLANKAPWVQRVHGVKGFDAAHRQCAERSETDWFITVDADNIVDEAFFNQVITLDPVGHPRLCLTWNGLNMMNGLIYGNGGIKLWSKEFVLSGGVGHEATDDPKHAVDFCWQKDYRSRNECFSEVWNNSTPFQAYRVGFREGVKLTLDGGERILAKDMKKLHKVNIRNIRIWSSVGRHVPNGEWAILGARSGWASMLDPEFDHVVVRDYDWFDDHWKNDAPDLGSINYLGSQIESQTGISLVQLDAEASAFFQETFRWRNE